MAPAGKTSPPYLIVDGHSMIFAWEELRELHDSSPAAAREQLAHRLTTYQDTTGERVVLVFDGKGERAKPETETGDPDDIQVFYSPAGTSADTIIERLAAKYAERRRLTVASRDRAVLDTCSAFGADAISANALLELVERAEAALRGKFGGR